MDRVTVAEAARILGIKEESVRKRVSRGKLRADKDPDGRLLVYVDSTETVRDEYTDTSPDRDELVVELRDRVRSLERRLDDEGESRRRADTIIAQLTQANAALTEQLRELEEPQTSEKAAQEPAEGVAGVQPCRVLERPQRAVQSLGGYGAGGRTGLYLRCWATHSPS